MAVNGTLKMGVEENPTNPQLVWSQPNLSPEAANCQCLPHTAGSLLIFIMKDWTFEENLFKKHRKEEIKKRNFKKEWYFVFERAGRFNMEGEKDAGNKHDGRGLLSISRRPGR